MIEPASDPTPVTEDAYVVTFSCEQISGPGALDGLRRMTLSEAHSLMRTASLIPKSGRIVNVRTLEMVSEPEGDRL